MCVYFQSIIFRQMKGVGSRELKLIIMMVTVCCWIPWLIAVASRNQPWTARESNQDTNSYYYGGYDVDFLFFLLLLEIFEFDIIVLNCYVTLHLFHIFSIKTSLNFDHILDMPKREYRPIIRDFRQHNKRSHFRDETPT